MLQGALAVLACLLLTSCTGEVVRLVVVSDECPADDAKNLDRRAGALSGRALGARRRGGRRAGPGASALFERGRAGPRPARPIADRGQDVNNWLGRSQFSPDTRFGGSFLEFRMYAAALSALELEHSRGLGPSPAFLPRPAEAQEPTGALP